MITRSCGDRERWTMCSVSGSNELANGASDSVNRGKFLNN
jgi:hypothetical protein